jgi:RNAse (barnase) inhibitor barstar
MNIDDLRRIDSHLQLMLVRADAPQVPAFYSALRAAKAAVYELRGIEMRSQSTLFDEFQVALEFPDYFGHNWDALSECITDMGWAQVGAGIVLVIDDCDVVLSQGSATDLDRLVRLLSRASSEWGQEIAEGEWWDRPPVAFHVLLACDDSKVEIVRERWSSAGAVIADGVQSVEV